MDCCTASGPESLFSMTDKDSLILDLEILKDHVSDSDRCTICKTINYLKTDEHGGNTSGLMWLIPLLCFAFMPPSGNSIFDLDFIEVVTETLRKRNEVGEVENESH